MNNLPPIILHKVLFEILDRLPEVGIFILIEEPKGSGYKRIWRNKGGDEIVPHRVSINSKFGDIDKLADNFGNYKLDGTRYTNNELPIIRAFNGEFIREERVLIKPEGQDGIEVIQMAWPFEDEYVKGSVCMLIYTPKQKMENSAREAMIAISKFQKYLNEIDTEAL